MTIPAPRRRRTPPTRGMLATQPVSATDWGEMARQYNWLKSAPRVLVPSLYLSSSYGWSDLDDYKMALRLYPSGVHHTRRWTIRAIGTGSVEYTIGSLDTVTAGVEEAPSATRTPALAVTSITEELASLPTALSPVDVDFRFTVGESDSWRLMDLSCWEVPQPYLTDSQGQSLSRIVSGQPMIASEVATLRSGATDDLLGHRVLGHWAVPYANGAGTTTTTFAASTTGSTFASAWSAAIPVVPRQLLSATTTSVFADVFCWVSSGGSGEIRLSTTDSGAGGEEVITNTAPDWTTLLAEDVTVEDMSSATGLSGGSWNLLDLEFRATVGTLYVASAVAYEATS